MLALIFVLLFLLASSTSRVLAMSSVRMMVEVRVRDSVSFVPWVCGGRYQPVLWSVSPPDYLSLLTSLHPLEDRDTVEVWTFQYYKYFIFRSTHIGWLTI